MPRTNVARLDLGGGLEAGFDPGSAWEVLFRTVNTVVVQAAEKCCWAAASRAEGTTNLARLNTNGTLDTSFTVQADESVNALALQTNDAVIVGGFFTRVNGTARTGIARLNTNGVLDADFNPSLSGAFSAVQCPDAPE
jgi:hypothetical protein